MTWLSRLFPQSPSLQRLATLRGHASCARIQDGANEGTRGFRPFTSLLDPALPANPLQP